MRRFLITTIIGFLLLFTDRESRGQGFSDEFDGPTLHPGWSWIREDTTHWKLTGAELMILTQPGGIEGTLFNNTKNILLQPAPQGDFSFEAGVSFGPRDYFQSAGILYYINDDNFIRLTSAKVRNPYWEIYLDYEIRGVNKYKTIYAIEGPPLQGESSDGISKLQMTGGTQSGSQGLCLRLTRTAGKVFSVTVDDPRIPWINPFKDTLDFPPGNIRIGIQASNGDGVAAIGGHIPAYFHYFRVNLNVSSENIPAIADSPAIRAIYPNPASSSSQVSILYDIPSAAHILLRVVDILGREVWKETEFHPAAGSYSSTIKTLGLFPGVYFVHITVGGTNLSERFTVLK